MGERRSSDTTRRCRFLLRGEGLCTSGGTPSGAREEWGVRHCGVAPLYEFERACDVGGREGNVGVEVLKADASPSGFVT